MNPKQIQQISTFLLAYPKDVVELGIEAWRTGEMPVVMEGISSGKVRVVFHGGNQGKC